MTASRILVVDDEADIRGLLKEILSEEGYEVEVAGRRHAGARSSRATHVPDLVLLDIWMPDTDGITLLREWSVTDGYDCPVVMMSGHGTVETAVEATRLGAFDFVEKPLSLTKLLRTVERALDAGRRKRLSERTRGSALAVPDRQEQAHAKAARAGATGRLQLIAGAARRRAGFRPRGLRALSAFIVRALRQAVRHGRGRQPRRRIRRRRCSAASATARSSPGAFDQAAGGTLYINGLEDLNAEAQRALLGAIEQNGYTRVGGRAALAAQRALDQLGAGGLRDRSRRRSRSAAT